jgi:hypothetical protein
VRRFLYDNGLTLAFLALFLGSLVGHAIAGHEVFNDEQDRHQAEQISLGRYLTSSDFAAAVTENWQSEYLQFALLIFLTIWLVQRGSTESKKPGKEGLESPKEQKIGEHAPPDAPRWARVGGVRTFLYSNSLLIVMGLFWVGSWFAQSVAGMSEFNEDRLSHQEDSLSWVSYIGTASFWERTLQNWQSEFLAVASMAIFAVYLRQRGSPESKPVGESHATTAVEG